MFYYYLKLNYYLINIYFFVLVSKQPEDENRVFESTCKIKNMILYWPFVP